MFRAGELNAELVSIANRMHFGVGRDAQFEPSFAGRGVSTLAWFLP
jgi:hypothetical protein